MLLVKGSCKLAHPKGGSEEQYCFPAIDPGRIPLVSVGLRVIHNSKFSGFC